MSVQRVRPSTRLASWAHKWDCIPDGFLGGCRWFVTLRADYEGATRQAVAEQVKRFCRGVKRWRGFPPVAFCIGQGKARAHFHALIAGSFESVQTLRQRWLERFPWMANTLKLEVMADGFPTDGGGSTCHARLCGQTGARIALRYMTGDRRGNPGATRHGGFYSNMPMQEPIIFESVVSAEETKRAFVAERRRLYAPDKLAAKAHQREGLRGEGSPLHDALPFNHRAEAIAFLKAFGVRPDVLRLMIAQRIRSRLSSEQLRALTTRTRTRRDTRTREGLSELRFLVETRKAAERRAAERRAADRRRRTFRPSKADIRGEFFAI